jgi:hypothetical protein
MKKLIVMLLTLISVYTWGQVPLKYSEVIQVDSVSANELYNRAKLWLASSYNSSKEVLQIDNKNDGQIFGKALFVYKPTVFVSSEQIKGNIDYAISITVKDGRYKYEVTNFVHDPIGTGWGKLSFGLITTDAQCPNPPSRSTGWCNKVWADIKDQIGDNIPALIASLKRGMAKATESEKDDW